MLPRGFQVPWLQWRLMNFRFDIIKRFSHTPAIFAEHASYQSNVYCRSWLPLDAWNCDIFVGVCFDVVLVLMGGVLLGNYCW